MKKLLTYANMKNAIAFASYIFSILCLTIHCKNVCKNSINISVENGKFKFIDTTSIILLTSAKLKATDTENNYIDAYQFCNSNRVVKHAFFSKTIRDKYPSYPIEYLHPKASLFKDSVIERNSFWLIVPLNPVLLNFPLFKYKADVFYKYCFGGQQFAMLQVGDKDSTATSGQIIAAYDKYLRQINKIYFNPY
jgi:hypothetical protein